MINFDWFIMPGEYHDEKSKILNREDSDKGGSSQVVSLFIKW